MLAELTAPLNDQGFKMRAATDDDIEGIVAVINASSMDSLGTPRVTINRQKRWFEISGINLATDSRLVTRTAGEEQVVGYLCLLSESPHVVSAINGVVHPSYRGRGIGTSLLRWAEQRAHELLPLAPLGARVVLHCDIFDANQPGRELLLAEGYDMVRDFIHLQIEMNDPPIRPTWPAGVTVDDITPERWPAVVTALEEAFQDHWGIINDDSGAAAAEEDGNDQESAPPTEEDKAYFNTPGLCFVAMAGDEVVGSCLCNAKTVEFAGTGRLGSLSVRRPWRRQGIGLALTLHALGEFYRRGTRKVVTDTDGQNFTGSYRLYDKAGMTVYRREELYEKEIRAGKDLLKREA
jgi:ribosomal protein S18 acetylase RimI-like enzyme